MQARTGLTGRPGDTGRGTLLLLVLALLAASSGSAQVLGQVALNPVRIDGALVPTGTSVLSPSLVESGRYSSTVHLSTGHILNLGVNSSAYLVSGREGGIQVALRGGQGRIGDPLGRTFQLARNMIALDPAAGEGQELLTDTQVRQRRARVDQASEDVDRLIEQARSDSDPQVLDCLNEKRSRLDSLSHIADRAAVAQRQAVADDNLDQARRHQSRVVQAASRAEEILVEARGCSALPPPPEPTPDPPTPTPPTPSPNGGLSTGAKIGIGLGVGIGTTIVIEELDDDPVEVDCQAADASPFRPGVPICPT